MTPEWLLETMKNVVLWGVLVYPNGDVTLQGFICDYGRIADYPAQVLHTRPIDSGVQIKIYLTKCATI